jgi:integrase
MSERINGFKVSIYPERDRQTGKILHYTGAIDLGYHPDGRRNRPKRKGATKTAVRAKLTQLAEEIQHGVKVDRDETVLKVATDFVALRKRQGLAPSTLRNHESTLNRHIAKIGHIKLRDLTVQQVEKWLSDISERLSPGSVQHVHSLLSQAIDHAMRRDKVKRNVSRMALHVKGERSGRESKSLTQEQVKAIFALACTHRFAPYVILGITSGLRVDELNALTWSDLELDGAIGTVSVVRATRHSGDTKTKQSKRALQLAGIALSALRWQRRQQSAEFAALGRLVSGQTHVFTKPDGTPYQAPSARREFRSVLRAAKVPNPSDWTTRETRTTFVSIMSDAGVQAEEIADMCGHDVRTLFAYYRKQLKPRLRESANVINTVFGARPESPMAA